MDFYKEVKQIFTNYEQKFGLKLIEIDDHEVSFIGNDYALGIGWSLDGIDLHYFQLINSTLCKFSLDVLLDSKLTQRERGGIVLSKTIYEKIINELIICERGIGNHFQEMLKGNHLSCLSDKEFVTVTEKNIIEHELLSNK
ncbi:hypothetical protein [Listeria seeligeri]|uniref:hypothetical protein n=1 Tax=Listeria seeligeri TaxID=1640 RepID=UPI0010E8C696|nr:hypothetical protein [Listeria seeligeri]